MRTLHIKWKATRREAKILLVISVIVGVVLLASFTAMVVLSSGSSVSPEALNRINMIFKFSFVAGLGCLRAFVVDGNRKHQAKSAPEIEDVDQTPDQEVAEELVELWDGTKPWQPSPAWQREREQAWRQQ